METTEALQQLLSMVGSAGEGAFALAVLYILKGYFAGGLLAGTVVYIALQVVRIVRMNTEDRQLLQTICDMLRVEDTYGTPLQYDGYQSEKVTLLKAVHKAGTNEVS